MVGIYKITSPSGKIYIGQSVDIERRFHQYERLECKGQTHLYRSFLKYSFEAHSIEIIEECSIDSLNERERYWQEFYDVIKGGLNCKLTTTKDKTGYFSDQTKKRISESLKGRKQTEKQKKDKSFRMMGNLNHRFGVKHTSESILKITKNRNRCYKGENNWMYGKTHSAEAKFKISESAKINKNRSKIVIDLNTGVFYDSLLDYVKYSRFARIYVWKRITGKVENDLNIIYA